MMWTDQRSHVIGPSKTGGWDGARDAQMGKGMELRDIRGRNQQGLCSVARELLDMHGL